MEIKAFTFALFLKDGCKKAIKTKQKLTVWKQKKAKNNKIKEMLIIRQNIL